MSNLVAAKRTPDSQGDAGSADAEPSSGAPADSVSAAWLSVQTDPADVTGTHIYTGSRHFDSRLGPLMSTICCMLLLNPHHHISLLR